MDTRTAVLPAPTPDVWDRRLRRAALVLAAAVLLGIGALLGGWLVSAQTYDVQEYTAARAEAADEGYRSGYEEGYAQGRADERAQEQRPADEPADERSWWERLLGL
jgi:hypothetical protein